MKLFKKIKYLLPSVFVAAGSLFTSCTDDVIAPGGEANPENGINIAISVSPLSEMVMTKANSERTDRSRIEDMNIVLADANDVIQKIIYVNSGSGQGSIGVDEDGLLTGSLPAEDGSLTYHVGKTSMQGVKKVFVVCNYWQINRETGEILPEKNNLNNCLTVGTSTIDELKALQQGTPFKPGIMTSTLFGEATSVTGTEAHGGQNYKCELKRTTAMITVAIETGGTNKLNAGVKITPRSICLHNVPVNCNIGIENKVETNDRISEEGLVQQVGWDPLVESNEKITVGGHGNDPNIVPVFMFENLQGEYGDKNGNQINKAPEPEIEKYCSYIEVIADYLYTPQASGQNQKYISGPIKYRLYLGENITNDFNVHRNKHYQVTLSLKGMGGLVEDGRTNSDGSYIGDGEGASWRVESGGVTGGGSFLSDGLNMASNGFLSYVGFVKEPDHRYRIYSDSDVPWLWSVTKDSYGGLAGLTKGTDVVVFEADQCGGEEGISYVKIFAQTWIDESPYEWSKYVNNNDLTSWINDGKRTAQLILWDETDSKEVSRFELRQWLPMPVMVNNNGDKITNPFEASLYYSRIDVYEGKELPWGPSYFDNWDVSALNTNAYNYADNQNIYPHRPFDSRYGFDNIVALYGTNPSAFDFEEDYGRPANTIGIAIFRAANAVRSGGGSINYDNIEYFGRIGLPTTEEWEKIKEYGVVDVRFGISNVPYWTSSMSSTQTYTYNPIIGDKKLVNRTDKYRVRLVYHKNDFAGKNWN